MNQGKPSWTVLILFFGIMWLMQAIASPLHAIHRVFYLVLGWVIWNYRAPFEHAIEEASTNKKLIRLFTAIAAFGFVFEGGHILRKVLGPVTFIEDIAGVYLEAIREI
jgi:hypothetical protein